MSLGRAGVSVQFGACVGDFFANLNISKKNIYEKNILLAAGAGAGLAAIFNAPLAGMIFCIEELKKSFTSEFLIATITATVAASSVVELFFGVRPVFETISIAPTNFPAVLTLPTPDMISALSVAPLKFTLYFVVMGIFLGVFGAFFTKSLLFSLDFYDKLKIFGIKRFLIPLLSVALIGKFLPEILGCGNILVDELLSSDFGLKFLFILLVGKFLFTLLCFGTNAPGGIFLPLLVVGALAGNIFAKLGVIFGLYSTEWNTLFIIFGMAAFFAAVVKAPVTGCILILELTGQFSHLLALLIVSGAAFFASDLCGGKPVYSALLERNKKISVEKT